MDSDCVRQAPDPPEFLEAQGQIIIFAITVKRQIFVEQRFPQGSGSDDRVAGGREGDEAPGPVGTVPWSRLRLRSRSARASSREIFPSASKMPEIATTSGFVSRKLTAFAR